MQLFGGLDEMMGDQYWVVDQTQGDHGWYAMGLLPHVKKMPKDVVKAANTDADPKNDYIIYAQSGDFAGKSVYGICFGIPLIMYLIWFAFIIGFPGQGRPLPAAAQDLYHRRHHLLFGCCQPLPDAHRR